MSLKDLRLKARLSQHALGVALARKLGDPEDEGRYYQPRIAAYESGRNAMPLPVAIALVSVLNAALRKARCRTKVMVEDLAERPKKKPRG